jgi:GNAT superfamily N-acetyltransferase
MWDRIQLVMLKELARAESESGTSRQFTRCNGMSGVGVNTGSNQQSVKTPLLTQSGHDECRVSSYGSNSNQLCQSRRITTKATGEEQEMDEQSRRLIIRPASRTDLPQLLALYPHLDATDRIPTLEVAERRFEQLKAYPGSEILIGLNEGAVVTSCTLIVIPNLTRGGQPYGLIENVVTHREFRGRGYGKSLLRAAVDSAWEYDCYKVMLMTGSKKPSTLAFYASAGFEQNKTGFQVRRIPVRAD